MEEAEARIKSQETGPKRQWKILSESNGKNEFYTFHLLKKNN